jgi:hypothetical protein
MITTDDLTHTKACSILKEIVEVMDRSERDLEAFDDIENILIKAELV